MGPGNFFFETWKSPGNLFLKKGTNPVVSQYCINVSVHW